MIMNEPAYSSCSSSARGSVSGMSLNLKHTYEYHDLGVRAGESVGQLKARVRGHCFFNCSGRRPDDLLFLALRPRARAS